MNKLNGLDYPTLNDWLKYKKPLCPHCHKNLKEVGYHSIEHFSIINDYYWSHNIKKFVGMEKLRERAFDEKFYCNNCKREIELEKPNAKKRRG